MSDIRYSFLNTVDHFPSDLIRTLWLIQSLDTRVCDEHEQFDLVKDNLIAQSSLLTSLVNDQLETLQAQKEELQIQQNVKRRYTNIMKKHPILVKKLQGQEIKQMVTKTGKMKIKISLKQLRNQEIIQQYQRPVEIAPVERYCFCQRESFGEMIACDNKKCLIEWFHYGCVGITQTPKGKWYCNDKCKQQASSSIKKNRNNKKKRY